MNKAGKIRLAVFIAILVILSYFSVGYTYEIFSYSVNNYLIDTGNINDVNIDGSDVTTIFRTIGYGMNTFGRIIVLGINAIVIVIMSLVFAIPFRLIGLRKNTKVSALEINITKWSFIGVTILSVITGLIITKCMVIIPLLIYTALWAMVIFFFYVLFILKYNIVE